MENMNPCLDYKSLHGVKTEGHSGYDNKGYP